MRIAIVGSGISGLASAWLLSREHEVTLFEADSRLGGHTHTHDIQLDGSRHRVDTGFIVFNRGNYPLLSRMFDALDIESLPTAMSFSVHNEATGLEYNASSLRQLFCQPGNLLSPRFLGMLRNLFRFYREAGDLLLKSDCSLTLEQYLTREGYGEAFRDDHLVPMASALWSSPSQQILGFPARYLAEFMANHQMLQVSDRPQWRVVKGGSSSYIEAMRRHWHVQERVACPVHSVRRNRGGVEVSSGAGTETFDQLVLACHSDQALRLLLDANVQERQILGAIPYQSNDVVLHTDPGVLPRRPQAWAAWNAWVPRAPDAACTVSYCMNLLQGIESTQPLVVTLNRTQAIDPVKILRRMHYRHPVYTVDSFAAQQRKSEIQGQRNTWYTGAWWGWGFHEDGMRSAVEVAEALGVAFRDRVQAQARTNAKESQPDARQHAA